MADGMTFDSAPVKQDTPVPSSPPAGGMTFDAAPVKQDTPVAATAPTGGYYPFQKAAQLMAGATGAMGEMFGEPLPGEDVPLIGPISAGVRKGAAKTFTGASQFFTNRGVTPSPVFGSARGATPEQLETHGGLEWIGNLWENIGEFMQGGEALESLSASMRLTKMARLAKIMEEFPRLAEAIQRYPALAKVAGALPAAAQQGAVAGAQTYVKTGGDLDAATKAAGLTGLIGVTMPGASEGLAGQIEQRAATQEMVGGVAATIPRELRNVQPTPQQAQGQEAIVNAARQTMAGQLQELNESRAVPPTENLPALPARTGQYQFELPGVPPTETTTGQVRPPEKGGGIVSTVPAAQMPRRNITGLGTQVETVPESQSARNVRELGSTAAATPPRLMRDQPYVTAVAPGAETEAVTPPRGGGVLRTEDPNVARAHIGRLNEIVDSPEFEQMPKDQQQQILDARSEAQRQVAEYHRQNNPNYVRSDIIDRLGDIADSLKPGEPGAAPEAAEAATMRSRAIADARDRIERSDLSPELKTRVMRKLDALANEPLPPVAEGRRYYSTSAENMRQRILDVRTQLQMAQPEPPLQRGPNFPQIDIPETVKQFGSWTEGVQHLEDTLTEGYNSITDALGLNDISGGKFNAIKNASKEAWREYKGAVGEDALEAAGNRMDQTSQQMIDLLHKDIGDAVSPKELSGLEDGWRALQMGRRVAKAVDGAFSGNASPAAKSWEYRGFSGNQLISNLDKLIARYGRDAVVRFTGEDSLNTLYQTGELNRTPAQRAKFGAVTDGTTGWLQQNYPKLLRHLGVASAMAKVGAHIGGGFGAVALPLTVESATALTKWTVNKILSDPKIANNVIWAVREGIRPEVYGPIIGGLIVKSVSSQ